MTIKVKMYPHPGGVKGTSGIDQVVLAYGKYLPDFGIEIARPESDTFDLVAGHAGTGATLQHPFACHVHGLHWTADYACDTWQYGINKKVIESIRTASAVTVPSTWVAETFQRDMRFTPHIIPHGIDVDDWAHDGSRGNYVLWNKNRGHDVCDAAPAAALAQRFPKTHFVTTFLPRGVPPMGNVNTIGLIPHDQMKRLVQSAQVYLSTTKETFGIGTLEAMASGVPILGFAHGGNVALVQHGVNGYLAKPGDFDDLAEGLKYCLAYRDKLGTNGRELARTWTWPRAVEMVAEVYRTVLEPEPPTVAVVIPCYNLGDKLGRAIESTLNQTGKVTEIVIVDDGSDDHETIRQIYQKFRNDAIKIRLLRQNNAGVAAARNLGTSQTNTKYVVCLDADDAIAPEFIETCVQALEADRSLGVAYTGLWYIKPDGQEGLSKWPGDWDFDAHLEKHNQIPTCAVFRREAWERLGGYKSRYCPRGAGEEDAEFYLRMGAYGYGAKKVTKEGLFIYSWQSGRVSGNTNHEATDWTLWHPWAGDGRDKKHPFASYVTPERHSHPVRQYDEPTISVIIPVGPGHEQHVRNALDSLEAQTFRGWEVIVVDDTHCNLDPEQYAQMGILSLLSKSYPYIKGVVTPGNNGAGYARNRGAEIARAPLLVFLDADDWLYPTALEKMLYSWNEYQSIIYTDYTSKAIVKTEYMRKIESENRLHAVLKSFDDGGETWHEIAYKSKAFDYDCERAQLQPQADEKGNYYVWCNVTVLIPKAWHDEIGGFDESLESWEDVDYHWRLAKLDKCYHRITDELLVYNYHQGHRRERGRQTHEKLLYYISRKHKELKIVGCRGCGRANRMAASRQTTSGVFAAQGQKVLSSIDDDNFVLCWYMHGNRGNHRVIGAAIHNKKIDGLNMIPKRASPEGWAIDYGYKSGGRKEKFLVHRADIAAQSHYFMPIEERQAVAVPEPEKVELGEPPQIVRDGAGVDDLSTSDNAADSRSVVDMGELSMPEQLEVPEPLPMPEPIDVEAIISGKQDTSPMFELQKIPGVNVNIARNLIAAGHTTREAVATLGVDGLLKIKGVGGVKAQMIIRAASNSE